MSTAALQMISGDVDVIILAANQVPASVAARSLAQQGSTVPVITSYVNADASWLGLVSEVLGSFDVYASAWIDVAGSPEDLETYVTEVSKIDPALAGNAFAFAGWIAAATFVEGLRRVGDDALTWENYINAMEASPVELPFGVVVDYANSRRVGTQAMAFLKAEVTNGIPAWSTVQPIQTIDDILN
jgi:ABC-type branched-subunit amino acid transport system substrate-binding protein